MRCEVCQSLIEEYLDQELKQPEIEAVSDHLRSCTPCETVAQKLAAEQKLYASYAPDLDIKHLWAGVQSRLDHDVNLKTPNSFWANARAVWSAPRVSGWATAALILLAIASTAIFMKYTQNVKPLPAPNTTVENKAIEKPAETVNSTVAVIDHPAPLARSVNPTIKHVSTSARNNRGDDLPKTTVGVKTPTQLVHEAELKYLAAIGMLSRNAGQRRASMDTATLAKLDQAIAAIDRTIAGTRKVAREHPDDPVAVQYMLTAYSRKVDVLREMTSR